MDNVNKIADTPAMRRKKPEQYHHGDLRPALVAGAMRLLKDQSAAELSLRAVARLAGVSPNAPYRHFASKDALLAAVAEDGFRRLAAAMDAASGPPRKRLAQMGVAYVRFATENSRLYGLMFGPVLCDWARFEGLVAAADASFELLVDAVAKATGDDRKSAPREAMLAWSAVHGYSMLAIDGHLDACRAGERPKPEELVRIITGR